MPSILRLLLGLTLMQGSFFSPAIFAKPAPLQPDDAINNLNAPLYNPFVERYVLDELKQLRVDLASQKHELMQQVLDREHHSVDRGVRYATDTITYFFYLIAGATSVLVLVGWTSIREIKDRVHSLADEEISRLVQEYENRLNNIEQEIQKKSDHIQENRAEIELSRDVQSLWLRAQQDASPASKIAIYDQILKIRHNDCEALTYKADAVLELNEPQWAANLCMQALQIDAKNSHAFYQLACAHTQMDHLDEAVQFLKHALTHRDNLKDEIANDPALEKLHGHATFEQLINTPVNS